MKLVKVFAIILGVLMVISGFFCLLNPTLTYMGTGYAIGAAMLFDAFAHIHAWFQLRKTKEGDGWLLAIGILSLISGLILITDVVAQLVMNDFVAYMAGVWLLIHAGIVIANAFLIRKAGQSSKTGAIGRNWWVLLILGILMCIFAVLGLMNPTIIMAAIGTFIGLGTIMAGCETITIAMLPAIE